MVHGKKRIPYWIDWRLPGLAGPEYHAVISFGLPIEPEDSQYGEYRLIYRLPYQGNPILYRRYVFFLVDVANPLPTVPNHRLSFQTSPTLTSPDTSFSSSSTRW